MIKSHCCGKYGSACCHLFVWQLCYQARFQHVQSESRCSGSACGTIALEHCRGMVRVCFRYLCGDCANSENFNVPKTVTCQEGVREPNPQERCRKRDSQHV